MKYFFAKCLFTKISNFPYWVRLGFNCIVNCSPKLFNVFIVSSMNLITLMTSTTFWWPLMLLETISLFLNAALVGLTRLDYYHFLCWSNCSEGVAVPVLVVWFGFSMILIRFVLLMSLILMVLFPWYYWCLVIWVFVWYRVCWVGYWFQ